MDRLFKDGFFRLGAIRGAPILLHFTYFIGAAFFCRASLGRWIAFFFLILIHELGHAVLARWSGHPVVAIEIHGLGGLCRYAGYSTPFDTALIAWGGVWAQGIVYIAASLVEDLGPPLPAGLAYDVLSGLTHTNVSIMLFNLIPIPPLDGAEAWKLFRLLWSHAQTERPKTYQKKAKPKKPAPKLEAIALGREPPRPSLPELPATEKEEIFQKMLKQLDEAPQHLDGEDK
ncbi:MAG: hypothetical protein U1E65_35000 [Myxococcota bacterium]